MKLKYKESINTQPLPCKSRPLYCILVSRLLYLHLTFDNTSHALRFNFKTRGRETVK